MILILFGFQEIENNLHDDSEYLIRHLNVKLSKKDVKAFKDYLNHKTSLNKVS